MTYTTPNQAQLLVRFGYTYEEIRNWTQGYAGKVLREQFESRKKSKKKK